MKKVGLFLTAFVALLFSCSNLNVQSHSSEFGSLVLSGGAERAIVANEIKSAVATVYGTDISSPVFADAKDVVNGVGSVTIDGIPVGKNRIVRVEAKDASGAKITEYVISAVADINADAVTPVNITWSSTVKGNLYYAACKAMDVGDPAIAEKLDGIAQKITEGGTHASLVDFTKIVNGFHSIDASAFSVDSYLRKTATVTIHCYGIDGTSVSVADPASSVKTVSGDEATVEIEDVLTGEWGVYTKQGDTYIKVGAVKVGEDGGSFQIGAADDEPILPRNEETEYDGVKVLVNKAKSSTYSYIWYWDCLDSSGKPMTAYPDSETDHKWGAFEKLSDDGTYYYKEFKKAAKVSVLIVTASGGKLYTTGNDDADGSNFIAPGIYEITSSGATKQAGAGPSISLSKGDGATFSSDSIDVVITAENCTTARYTIDGTNPYSSKTAVSFSGTKTISLGAGLSVGGKATLRVYGDDGKVYTDATAMYEKVEKSATPTRLGAYYTHSATSFSIWSPDSSNVTVTVTPRGGVAKEYQCEKGFAVDGDYPDAQNIYGVTVQGDLHLAEYQFKIGGVAVRDPYGKMIKYEDADAKTNVIKANYVENSCTITSYAGSSVNIVMDMDKTMPTGGWADRPALINRADSIVYEVHVQDFTSSSTWGGSSKNKGKFSGMVESGTAYSGVKTGLDHLKELGITHVQIMPMYDFATKYNASVGEYYNWGYDPVNFNVPEDRYSTCPDDYVERVREVKDMINEFHKNGIRVIMDVVYNHTFDKEMFKNITNSYYTATDLSGCGNSVNTNVSMVSRFIRDSLEYWLEEYNIDGFRFDLMAIFTTEAVKDWGSYLNGKFGDRNILMYGEPWQANNNNNYSYAYASAISGLNSVGVGCFNGKYREAIKGGSDDATKGYMFNAYNQTTNIQVGLKGSGTNLGSDSEGVWTRYFTASPYQSVNYITAHDNLCLYDKIVTAGVSDVDYQKQIVRFGHGIVLVSQGIPFIHCGDEFLRTKKVGKWAAEAHNSYMFGIEVNQIDWGLKAKNIDTFNYHKDLIALRKAHDGLRSNSSGNVGSTSVSEQIITYTVKDGNGASLVIVVNSDSNKQISHGTEIFNSSGATEASGIVGFSGKPKGVCEGTAVTVFKAN